MLTLTLYGSKPYATMQSDGFQAADVIKPLHKSLEAANLASIGITCCEGQGWSMQRDLTREVQAAGAENYTSLVTSHAYKGNPAAPDQPLNTSLKVWITENSPIEERLGLTGIWYRNGSENEGLVWANNLHNAFTVGNVSAYVYWIGAGPLYMEAPLVWVPRRTASTPESTLYYQIPANYYAFVHFSRYIRPGAVRLEVEADSTSPPALKTTAYVNKDGSFVVEAINNGDEVLQLSFGAPSGHGIHESKGFWRGWMTDNAHNMTQIETVVQDDDGTIHQALPARSLTTFLLGTSP